MCAITQPGTLLNFGRAVHGQCAIQRLDGSRIRMFEGEGSQSRTEIRNCGHRTRLPTPVDDRGSRRVESERAVVRNGEVKGRVDGWKWDLLSKDTSAGCYDC